MYGGMPPYACAGSLLFFALVQDPKASQANPYTCPGSRCFTLKALRFKFLRQGSLLPILTIPYAFKGSQHFKCKSLHLYRFLKIETTPYARSASPQFQHFLTPVQASNPSHANPYAYTGSQFFTLSSLHLYRSLTIPCKGEASLQF
ncbi:hypothetical protein O181_028008 [Austropuccinia psidii MF-1]|uniref:Secreted protein n=1 Tax=Austropuccinia psidii MF-1 TaxID=1389203 RepID=A0A9Q3CSW2_9BASI|nr:hypothetical protein [Austropuccinia psidii MF-1]